MTVNDYVGFSGSFQTFFFFFSVPKDVCLISIFKEDPRCYSCNCRGYHSVIHTFFSIRANENCFSQTRLMWSLNEKIAYTELPGTYFFLLGKTFAKGGYNWLVNQRGATLFSGSLATQTCIWGFDWNTAEADAALHPLYKLVWFISHFFQYSFNCRSEFILF